MNTNELLAPLADAFKKLQDENEGLRRKLDHLYEVQSRNGQLQRELSNAVSERDAAVKKSAEYWTNLLYWKKAARYEQSLKKPAKQIRHLPIFNEIKRAARRDNWPKFYVGNRTNPERIFLKHWRKENKRVPGLNGGYGVLELILSNDANEYAVPITQRDATVAATVIQWLGTNCGRCFVEECEREIKSSVDRERKAGAA